MHLVKDMSIVKFEDLLIQFGPHKDFDGNQSLYSVGTNNLDKSRKTI